MEDISEKMAKLLTKHGASTAMLVRISIEAGFPQETVNRSAEAGISLFLNEMKEIMTKHLSEKN